ncbi:sensor histidine kinase [Methylobacterium sp. A54F]
MSYGLGDERRVASLEAENAQLRALLAQACLRAEAEAERNSRLGQIFAAERSASRAEADRASAETERMRVAAAHTVALYRRDLAAGAARLASAQELNARLRASEEFNRRILWSSTDCVKVLDLDGRLITLSENGPSIFGVANFAGLIGRPWVGFWSCPESREQVMRALDEARAGRSGRFQAMLGAAGTDAAPTWWDIAVAPINGSDGQPERILAVSRDITDLKQNEARQTLLMQELAHRVKNTLALVQAVATQTLRNASSREAAGEALSARLVALAQAHDVLLQGSWSSADLRGLVNGAIILHGDGAPGRFRIVGPDVTLGPRPALTLALMLHELGTNAAKYGALSVPEGHVTVSWHLAGGEDTERLHLRWEEADGPSVAPPTRTGFGSRMIERSLIHSFGGEVHLTFPPTGVVLTLDAPLSAALGTAA